jgi:hypothetical protein
VRDIPITGLIMSTFRTQFVNSVPINQKFLRRSSIKEPPSTLQLTICTQFYLLFLVDMFLSTKKVNQVSQERTYKQKLRLTKDQSTSIKHKMQLPFIVKRRDTFGRQCMEHKNPSLLDVWKSVSVITNCGCHKDPGQGGLDIFHIIRPNFNKNVIFVISATSSIRLGRKRFNER